MDSPVAFACRELRLRQFRNLSDVTLVFPAAGVALIGDNGAGKTNLLEAIYYLEILRSFRGSPDEQLVRFGADAFHVRGVFVDARGRDTEITAAYEPRTRRKRVTVDGSEPDRISDAIGHLGAVVFSPADIGLVAGAPAERRRFLDILLSLGEPDYLAALQHYRRVLRHRNALLRSSTSVAAMAPWDDALIEHGSRIIAMRRRWVDEYAEPFRVRCEEIGGRAATLEYHASAIRGADGAITEAFAAALRRVAPRERERGLTLVGPHRDDLVFRMQGRDEAIDLREFGSGGQVRTAAIALRMIEAEYVRARRGRPPVLLLDDIFAELDPGRSSRILEMLDGRHPGQVVLTAPKETDIDQRTTGPLSSLARWRIDAGVIHA